MSTHELSPERRPQFPRDWTCAAHGDECSKFGLDWDCDPASMPQYTTKEKP